MSSWRTAGLNAATSGADGKRRRAFQRARSSGSRGSSTLTERVISWVLISDKLSVLRGDRDHYCAVYTYNTYKNANHLNFLIKKEFHCIAARWQPNPEFYISFVRNI